MGSAVAGAQVVSRAANPYGQVPTYSVTVVGRTITAVNYHVLGGTTSVDLRGTPLLPDAHGHADVRIERGATHISVDIDKCYPAQRFGPEYLTYVMWAITPDGRANNLGEVQLRGQSANMNVTTTLQDFGLIVTAEPYFGVTQPSNLVVMENFVKTDTVGAQAEVQAKYQLLDLGQYRLHVDPSQVTELPQDPKVPLDLYEAENAVRIAGWMGAGKYASDVYARAQAQLQQAEDYEARKAGKTPVATVARQAVQTAEDARLLTLKRREQERVAALRQADADRAAAAQAAAQAAQRETADAEAAKAQADAEREAASAHAAAAEKARADADAARAQAERQTADARSQVQAERQKLLNQLNSVLQTRDTASGLIMNMSDVLFQTNQATLEPGAKIKLAKVSGILLAYPDLKIQVNGYTDSTGTDDYNQQLSEHRADAVREFLTSQGVNSGAITSQGYGKDDPVAGNDTSEGRQQNRRVELVVNGAAIGSH
ncbi:MAG TPA: OmpA family protein [Terriglobales bacterium]|nr:OmpA family protein [Terriglobales bacterium]